MSLGLSCPLIDAPLKIKGVVGVLHDFVSGRGGGAARSRLEGCWPVSGVWIPQIQAKELVGVFRRRLGVYLPIVYMC